MQLLTKKVTLAIVAIVLVGWMDVWWFSGQIVCRETVIALELSYTILCSMASIYFYLMVTLLQYLLVRQLQLNL